MRLTEAQKLGIETCGRIAKFWGFTPSMGRTFGLLYLSPEPLAQADIQRRLGISAGNASMTLAGLVTWGVAHKVPRSGRRRDLYRSETDFWKMISGVLNQRERKEIRTAIQTVKRALKAAEREKSDQMTERLRQLQRICELGETMLDMLLGDLTLDVGRFRDVLRA